MRYIEDIGKNGDYIERKFARPRLYRCPQCGKKGKRIDIVSRVVPHVGMLNRRSWIVADVGVYKASCGCSKYFQAATPGVPYNGRYSFEVRNTVANAIVRDRMPYRSVIRRMSEDYLLDLSLGYIHDCFFWAHQQINMAAHWQFVLENFSGVICIDEVHDSGRTILFATDPLNDFTVSFQIAKENDQVHMDQFLQGLKDRGLKVEVAITDGSPLYKDSLQSYFADVEHQLCVFHVIKEVNKLILSGVRAIKNEIKAQGNKGRKRKRGNPKKAVQQREARRKEQGILTKKEEAAFIWDNQYLIVRKEEDLTDKEKENLALLFKIAPQLKTFRTFNRQFYKLFEKGITKTLARQRRTRLVNNPAYQGNAFLVKALKTLKKEKFEKMIVFLGWEDMERTNNHVERNNRAFRMLQKTRYKRRKQHTIEKALELELYARMLEHELYDLNRVNIPITLQKKSTLKMAA